MTSTDSATSRSLPTGALHPHPRSHVLRWQISYGTFGIPQAAAPITFSLLALPLTGRAESGAALMVAMTAAQILGSVPLSRLGRRFNAVHYLRGLIVVRFAALMTLTALAAVHAPIWSLVTAATVAGAVNGAAYGYQRLLLNHLVPPDRMPRSLGVGATLNEITFALFPVVASLVGAFSPVWAMALVAILGLTPLLLIPSVPEARSTAGKRPSGPRERLPRTALIWLLCAAASGSAVAAIEVGAVSFALSFDLDPGWSFLFASLLCIGSVLGGIWVSVRNRMPEAWKVLIFLAATVVGAALVLLGHSLLLTLAGALMIGLFLPILGTFYSLVLDRMVPGDRRAEIFALLRTCQALGIIAVSGVLAVLGLQAALASSFILLLAATVLVAAYLLWRAS